MHNTTSRALNQYLSMRVQLRATADTLFVSATGNVLSYNTVQAIFLRLARSVWAVSLANEVLASTTCAITPRFALA